MTDEKKLDFVEPWTVNTEHGVVVLDNEGGQIVDCLWLPIAQRIVDCMNACAGWDVADVATILEHVKMARDNRTALEFFSSHLRYYSADLGGLVETRVVFSEGVPRNE